MDDYLILFAVVLAVNLMPAFGPPTWSIIALYGLNSDLPVAAVVAIGALAAALGRFLLASSFRILGEKIPQRMQRNLAAAKLALEQRRGVAFVGLALFALSPIPSAQLFEAAGLAKVKLLAFTAAFFAGRLASYSFYALTARSLRDQTLGQVFAEHLTSPLGVLVQLLAIGALAALPAIDWQRLAGACRNIRERRRPPADPGDR